MLVILEQNDQRNKPFIDRNGPGNPIEAEDAINMMDAHLKRLKKAEDGKVTGVKHLKEASHVFFRREALTQLPAWDYFGIGLALAVRLEEASQNANPQNTSHRPPTKQELQQWEADPTKVTLVQTVIISETDEKGKFKFRKDARYQVYDYAGHCCVNKSDKRKCLEEGS